MKKLLLVLLALPLIGFGQQTYVPDNNFEAYLEANGMGNGIPNDDYVNTANINTVTYLDVSLKYC
jgi:hypothetical protein